MAIEVLVAVFFGRRGRCVGLAMGGGIRAPNIKLCNCIHRWLE
jgi:hypothetical protein